MIQTSEQTDALDAALAKAQADIENVKAEGKNPAFKRDGKESHYATLGGVLDEIRPKLAKHGIALFQAPVNGENGSVGVVTRLSYAGQWIQSVFFVTPTKFDAQGAGSVVTYLRRYAAMAAAGVAPEDDDGNAASLGAPAPRAGIHRAPDVPPRLHVREAWADTPHSGPADPRTGFELKGNGSLPGQSVEERAAIFRDEMNARFAKCKVPADIEVVLKNNSKALEGLKKIAPEVYAEIMTTANAAENAMYAGA